MSPRSRFSVLFLLLCSLSVLPTYASQKREQDKQTMLENLAAIPTGAPSRIPLLVSLVKVCWRACASDAKRYGKEALSLLDDWPDLEQETTLLIYLPRTYQRSGNNKHAQTLIERGLKSAKQLGDKGKLASIQFNQAMGLATQNQFILAEKAYQQLYDTYAELGRVDGMGSALNNMGRIRKRNDDFGKALEYYQAALALYEQDDPESSDTAMRSNAANTLANIGELYRLLGDVEMAETSIMRASSLVSEQTHPGIYNSVYTRLSDLYIEMGRHGEATSIILDILTRADEANVTIDLLSHFANLIQIALHSSDIEQAEQYLAEAKQRFPSVYNTAFRIAIADLRIRQQNLPGAVAILDGVVRRIEAGDISDDALALLNKLIEVTQLQQDWQQSAALLALLNTKIQEREKRNRDSRLAQFNIIYQANEKERIIADLEQQNHAKSIEVLTAQSSQKQIILLSLIVALVFFVIIFMGIQKRKMLALRAKLLQDNAEKKTRLFSDISHELRTPLSVLKLQLEGLEYDLVDDPKQTYALLHEKLGSINHLISDISQLAQADAGELTLNLESVDAFPFFEQWCLSASTAASQAGLLFSFNLDIPMDLQCDMDVVRINQVLTNLLSNSCRYSDAPGQIQFSLSVNKGQLRWRLFDSAPGLEDSKLSQVFERLYRADKSRSRKLGGSGLGLTICKSLIEAHNGKIRAKHSDLGGIQIDVSLPLLQRAQHHD